MDSKTRQQELSSELDKFASLLQTTLPRYKSLVKKVNISNEELQELGELEYFLIELNGKISDIKCQLENHLYGISLESYYKMKKEASLGDEDAAKKVVIMKKSFSEALKGNAFFNWN